DPGTPGLARGRGDIGSYGTGCQENRRKTRRDKGRVQRTRGNPCRKRPGCRGEEDPRALPGPGVQREKGDLSLSTVAPARDSAKFGRAREKTGRGPAAPVGSPWFYRASAGRGEGLEKRRKA